MIQKPTNDHTVTVGGTLKLPDGTSRVTIALVVATLANLPLPMNIRRQLLNEWRQRTRATLTQIDYLFLDRNYNPGDTHAMPNLPS